MEDRHQWVLLVTFELTDEQARLAVKGVLDPFVLRPELLGVEGPGCFRCEQRWSPELANQTCPGGERYHAAS